MAKKNLTPASPEPTEDNPTAASESPVDREFMVPWPTRIDPKTKQWVHEPKRSRLADFGEVHAHFIGLDKGIEGKHLGVNRTTYGQALGKKAPPMKANKPLPIEEDPQFKAVK